jgi:hypothetical protein
VTKQLCSLVCCALLLSSTVNVAHAQQAAAVGTPVIVTNTPGVAVLNTPSVNVANTPTVRVTNSVGVANAPSSPLYTLGADEVNSFQLTGNFTNTNGVSFSVPPNKVMVLDFVGFDYFGPSAPVFRVSCSLSNSRAGLLFAATPIQLPDYGTYNVLTVAQPIKLFGSSSCNVGTYRSFTGSIDYSLVGHYVNQ